MYDSDEKALDANSFGGSIGRLTYDSKKCPKLIALQGSPTPEKVHEKEEDEGRVVDAADGAVKQKEEEIL